MFQINKKDLSLIFIILFIAFSFRVMYLKDYKNTKAYPVLAHSDSYSYLVWAKDIVSGDFGSKAFMKWPLYAYFLAFLFQLFGENILLIYSLQFILGALNCIFIYIIAREIFDRRIGFVAGLLCAWYGLFVFYEGLLIYTGLSLFLNSLLFLFILNIKDNPGRKNLFWIGIFLGICTIAQASIAIFGILAIGWIIQLKKLTPIKTLINFSFFILGLFMVIGGVTLRNYLAEKDFVLIAGNIGINFYSGNNPRATGTFFCPADITLNQEDMFRDSGIIARYETGKDLKTSGVSNFWFNKAIEFIREDRVGYLKLLFKKITYCLSQYEFIHDIEYQLIAGKIGIPKIMFKDLSFLLPFGLLGMLIGVRRFKDSALLYIFLIAVSSSIVMFFIAARYR
ncbi:MAG: glycosyltransferase family 39 protein, partial [Candidatus Omnitrophica bacterium]|nr:glycosyltransferase family 39 protein [Candidatus Omnitrophota bacterium]